MRTQNTDHNRRIAELEEGQRKIAETLIHLEKTLENIIANQQKFTTILNEIT
jgi:hypothetical protein